MDSIKSGVQTVVNEIYQRDGEVRPSTLLEEAKPKTSPAHNAFEWDNKKAGQSYRLMQARMWIRKVEIIFEDRNEQLIHVPTVRVINPDDDDDFTPSQEGYYKPISIVCEDKDEYEAALRETLTFLNSAKSAYGGLKKAAQYSKQEKLPNFAQADKGFGMIDSALAMD